MMKGVAAVAAIAAVLSTLSVAQPPTQTPQPPDAIDPQQVQDQDTMTWADYRAIPAISWADATNKGSERTLRVALVAVDFEDQPFVITHSKGSDLFGNPQIDAVKRRRSHASTPTSGVSRVLSITATPFMHTGWNNRVAGWESRRSIPMARIGCLSGCFNKA